MPNLAAPWDQRRASIPLAGNAGDRQVSLEGRRILVAEDEYIIASDLDNYLTSLGAEVVGPVASIEAALLALDEQTVDAAILDIDLQGAKAFAVADRLVAMRIPFVFATGYDAQIIPKRFATITRCEKPSSPGAIVAALLARQGSH